MMDSVEFTFINDEHGLGELCRHLSGLKDIYLDTEADNLHHYETRVCLLQLRAGKRCFLVDPLVLKDLSALFAALEGKTLVMHGSDFDLRLLWELARFRPTRLFDTMLAAQLIGRQRIGLASLLEDYLEIHHPKDSQKSDWSRRPLPDKMLKYAVGDVEHLPALKRKIDAELKRLGRIEWHNQKCDWQIETAMSGFPKSDENAWRIGQSQKLPPPGLSALYELWHWREAEAMRRDLPPFKIITNDYLFRLADAAGSGQTERALASLPPKLFRSRGKGLQEALERATHRDPKTLPKRRINRERRQPLNNEELRRQDKLREFRDGVAGDLKIDPTLIASRANLAEIARQPQMVKDCLLPWQASLLEPGIEAVVDGSPRKKK